MYICIKITQMQLLLFILIYPFIWLISILPFRLLYLFSDFIYVVLYYGIGYRKRTVRENLALALPHLSDKERLIIEKKSMKHLCDLFLEMIKSITISRKEIEQRFVFTNLELYQEFEAKQKSIAIMCAHYASYEWLMSMNYHIKFKGIGIYKKIANPYFDNMVKKIRSKFKAELVDTKKTIDLMTEYQEKSILAVYGFASDQSPKLNKYTHYDTFMGVSVPVHTGAENLAKKMDLNVIFVKIKKPKRGFYEATFVDFASNPQEIPDYQITHDYLRLVEQQIIEAPEFYLWTHKRWKHRR
jgi:KDO2-lipid IV(A) lauroyltransferase